MSVSVTEFVKALLALEKAVGMPYSEITRDASIQRFEFTVELAWKTCKKQMGTQTSAPKEVIREMAQNGYIQDVAFWLKAIDMRNLSSHTYNEDVAQEVFEYIKQFVGEAKILQAKIVEKSK